VLKIIDVILFITQVESKPHLLLAHANFWCKKHKAHYPVTHNQFETFTASSTFQQVSIDNAYLGPIPERILIAMVRNNVFVGSASTNPFHYQYYDIANLVLYVNGVQHPSEPFTMECRSTFGATRASEALL